jgi:hypothetical protein
MLLNLLRRDGLSEPRHVEVGSNLHGLRWTSLTIESSEEAAKLLTDRGQDWWKRVVVFGFVKSKF